MASDRGDQAGETGDGSQANAAARGGPAAERGTSGAAETGRKAREANATSAARSEADRAPAEGVRGCGPEKTAGRRPTTAAAREAFMTRGLILYSHGWHYSAFQVKLRVFI